MGRVTKFYSFQQLTFQVDAMLLQCLLCKKNMDHVSFIANLNEFNWLMVDLDGHWFLRSRFKTNYFC